MEALETWGQLSGLRLLDDADDFGGAAPRAPPAPLPPAPCPVASRAALVGSLGEVAPGPHPLG